MSVLLSFLPLQTFALLVRVSAIPLIRDWITHGHRPKVPQVGVFVLFGSLAIRQPFTLEHARERVPAEDGRRPLYLQVNEVITGASALTSAVLIATDVLFLCRPRWSGLCIITAFALIATARFMAWYLDRKAVAR